MSQKISASEKRRRLSREDLSALVERHGGNRSAIARALTQRKIKSERQCITPLLREHGLLARADELSSLSMKGGRRDFITDEVQAERRAEIVIALASSRTRSAAAAMLGSVGIATLYRWIRSYQITDAEVQAVRDGAPPLATTPDEAPAPKQRAK